MLRLNVLSFSSSMGTALTFNHVLPPSSYHPRVPAVGLQFIWTSQATLATGLSCFLSKQPWKSHQQAEFQLGVQECLVLCSHSFQLCGGFKKTGVYPFNSEAVILHSTSSDQNGKRFTVNSDYQAHLVIKCILFIERILPSCSRAWFIKRMR